MATNRKYKPDYPGEMNRIETEKVLSAGVTETRTDSNTPNCSICIEERLVAAFKCCSTCKLRYCKDCLERCHPNQGELKTHQLMAVDAYTLEKSNGPEVMENIINGNFCGLSKDIAFKQMLLDISEELTSKEMKQFRFLLRDSDVGKAALLSCEDPLDLFDLLKEKGRLSVYNTVILQDLIWRIGRKELYNSMVEFACNSKDVIIHLCSPPKPCNGSKNVKIHVNCVLTRNHVDDVRAAVASWLRIPEGVIQVNGVEPTGSWTITLMIPEIAAGKIQELLNLNTQWLVERDIDILEISEQVWHVPEIVPNLTKASTQKCTKCKGEASFHAVVNCIRCTAFYCEKCLLILLKMTGRLHHQCHPLISVQEYLHLVEKESLGQDTDMKTVPCAGPLKVFLEMIETEIKLEDLSGFKDRMEGPEDISFKSFGDCQTLSKMFKDLEEAGWLTLNNTVILQELIWFTGRTDLYDKWVDFAWTIEDIVQICYSQEQTEQGYTNIRICTNDPPSRSDIEDMRAALAHWICIPVRLLVVAGLAPTGTCWCVTFAIPEMGAKHIPHILHLQRDWLAVLKINTIEMNGRVFNLSDDPKQWPTDFDEIKDERPSIDCEVKEERGKIDVDNCLDAVEKTHSSDLHSIMHHSEDTPAQLPSTSDSEDSKRLVKPFENLTFTSRRGNVSVSDAITPMLKFTKTISKQLKIIHDGFTLKCKDQTESDGHAEAWTDGQFKEGKLFWVIKIAVEHHSPDSLCRCLVGVVQEGSSLWDKPGLTSWCVDMVYRLDSFISLSQHGGGIEPGYRSWAAFKKSHVLGIVLECNANTLRFIDLSEKQVMLSLNGVNVSKPLTPAIRIECTSGKISAKASLVSPDKL